MRTRGYLLAVAATVALTVGSVTAIAATNGSASRPFTATGMTYGGTGSGCRVPSLAGQRVSVVLTDMTGAATMGGRAMMTAPIAGGSGSMMNVRMMLHASPSNVPAGTVSFVAYNHGSRSHELVLLPLPSGGSVGSRTVGADRSVAETGSLGEASNTCGANAGNGIESGSAGWVTLTLAHGRYELICNLPGHYAAGMYAEFDVT